MSYLDVTRAALPPYSPGSGAPGQHTYQRIAGVTTAEAATTRALKPGAVHVLKAGAIGVRIELRGEVVAGAQVDRTTSFLISPNTSIMLTPQVAKDADDNVRYGSIFIYASDDSVTPGTWELFVYQAGL